MNNIDIKKNTKKSEQLGMPHGTANARMRKIVLFDLLKRHNENVCFQCGKEIETVEELSIEHKKPWLDVDVKLFWDINNIGFSHLHCNCSVSTRAWKGQIKHGASSYCNHKCRCDICSKSKFKEVSEWKARKKLEPSN